MTEKSIWKPLEEYNFVDPNYFEQLKTTRFLGKDYTDYIEGFFRQIKEDLSIVYIRRDDDYKTSAITECAPNDKKLKLILYLADGFIREGTIAGAETLEFLFYKMDLKEGKRNDYQLYLADLGDYFSDKLNFLKDIPTSNPSYKIELETLEKLVSMRTKLRAEEETIERIGELIWGRDKIERFKNIKY